MTRDDLLVHLRESLRSAAAWARVRQWVASRGSVPDEAVREFAEERANNIAQWLVLSEVGDGDEER